MIFLSRGSSLAAHNVLGENEVTSQFLASFGNRNRASLCGPFETLGCQKRNKKNKLKKKQPNNLWQRRTDANLRPLAAGVIFKETNTERILSAPLEMGRVDPWLVNGTLP